MAEKTPSSTAPIVRLIGRIEQVRVITTSEGRAFMHLVKLPAPDQYSSPAAVSIKSREKLGSEGDDFNGQVQVGGYGRTYQQTDEETGRKTTVRTADNTLTAI